MTNKKEIKKTAGQALAKLADIPRIGSPFGGDFSLGFSHRRALEIAAETISDTPKNVTNTILGQLFDIFDRWKYEHGVYPPRVGLFGLLADQNSDTPAKEYCQRTLMAAKLKGKEANLPAPWECCPYVSTPVGLFWRIWGDGYTSLEDYIKNNWNHYETMLAILILISHNPNSTYQSSDCIDSAIKLASYRLIKQKAQIAIMKPDVEASLNRRKQQKIKQAEKKAATTQKIQLAYEECLKKGEQPKLETVAQDAGVSVATASRHLRAVSIKRYKTK